MRTVKCAGGCGGHLERTSYRICRRPYCAPCFDAVIGRLFTPDLVCRQCGESVTDSLARHIAAHERAAAA